MKFSALAAITIGLVAACSSTVNAAPHSKKIKHAVPQIISRRVVIPKNVPKVDKHGESRAIAMNPRLPHNVQQKFGFALNATSFPDTQISSFSSLPLASSSVINSLKIYMSLSASAYCPGVCPGSQWNCKNCDRAYTFIRSFQIGNFDVNGYITRNDQSKEIQLVFRGSHSIPNWIANILAVKKAYPPVPGASVHSGFFDAYMSTQSTVVPIIIDQLNKNPSYRVMVTGHSLGGALATFAGLDLYQRHEKINAANLIVRTYGGPRVGNDRFAYYFTSTAIPLERTVNNRDIVPHLPPQSSGFLHPGVEYWIDSSSNVRICDTSLDSGSCSNSIVPFTSTSDHTKYFNISNKDC
ncbi:Alpha/Beta hydrolase protein [Spinellus fusiger]|nr:Alpha/Beta hydrolase protein [Spinellus fusiger]